MIAVITFAGRLAITGGVLTLAALAAAMYAVVCSDHLQRHWNEPADPRRAKHAQIFRAIAIALFTLAALSFLVSGWIAP